MLLKPLLLILFFIVLKECIYAITRRQRKPKHRPINPSDKMDYSKVNPISAAIGGKYYHFSSTAEYRFALHLEKQKQEGKIKDWSYEETLFTFFARPLRGNFKPDGVKQVRHPNNGMSVGRTAAVKAYLPDFCITYPDKSEEYIEIKGRWTQRAKTAVENMRKFYPKVKLTIKYVN